MTKDFKVKLNKRNVDNDLLIEDIKLVARKLDKTAIARDDYEAHGEFSYTTIRRRFGSWYKALELAGLESTQRRINNSVEVLLENIANTWAKLGRQPVYQDMNQPPSLFTAKTYDNRFGSWNKALHEFARFIDSGQLPENVKEASTEFLTLKRTPRRINWKLRAKILIRDNCICKMCGACPSKNPEVILHVDHVEPWSKGGETVPENLQTLCLKCNIGKSDQELE